MFCYFVDAQFGKFWLPNLQDPNRTVRPSWRARSPPEGPFPGEQPPVGPQGFRVGSGTRAAGRCQPHGSDSAGWHRPTERCRSGETSSSSPGKHHHHLAVRKQAEPEPLIQSRRKGSKRSGSVVVLISNLCCLVLGKFHPISCIYILTQTSSQLVLFEPNLPDFR